MLIDIQPPFPGARCRDAIGRDAVLETRAVLAMVPPLLADIIRHVVPGRAADRGITLRIIAELDDLTEISARLSALRPDLLILGPPALTRSQPIELPRLISADLPVLTLSADLSQVFGPKETDRSPLTPDTLARLLAEVARSI